VLGCAMSFGGTMLYSIARTKNDAGNSSRIMTTRVEGQKKAQ
jgi:hypothetical protein